MPRANRHFIPGYVWHITHRCHKKDFLLKFDKDKSRLGLPREIDEVKSGAHIICGSPDSEGNNKKTLACPVAPEDGTGASFAP